MPKCIIRQRCHAAALLVKKEDKLVQKKFISASSRLPCCYCCLYGWQRVSARDGMLFAGLNMIITPFGFCLVDFFSLCREEGKIEAYGLRAHNGKFVLMVILFLLLYFKGAYIPDVYCRRTIDEFIDVFKSPVTYRILFVLPINFFPCIHSIFR